MVQILVYLIGGCPCPSAELASVLTRYSSAFAHLGAGKLASQELRRERDEPWSVLRGGGAAGWSRRWPARPKLRPSPRRGVSHPAAANTSAAATATAAPTAPAPLLGPLRARPAPGGERRRAPPAPPGPAVPERGRPALSIVRPPARATCRRRQGRAPLRASSASHNPPAHPLRSPAEPGRARAFLPCLPPSVPRLAELRRLPSPALSLPPTARPPPLRRCPPEPPTSP